MTWTRPRAWEGPSADPTDEQFGDVIEPARVGDADGYDAVLVGEPYDGAVIGRKGARRGPGAIRDALAGVKTHLFEAGPVVAAAELGDLGDLELPEGDVAGVQDAVRESATAVHASDALPVFLGGDNSLTYPNVAPLLADASVGVVSFDAHLDCRELHDGPSSGTPYRQLHAEGLDRLAVVGARHFETSSAYAAYLRERDGVVVTSEAVGAGVDAAVDRALDALAEVERVYLSVDLDVLDAPVAPGVSAPTPGGLSARELFAGVRRVARDDRLAGVEVVECAPPLDHTPTGRTAAAGARTVAHALAGALARGEVSAT